MRSINEIVIAIQDSQPVDLEEAKLCALALSYMLSSVERELREIADDIKCERGIFKLKAAMVAGGMESRFKGRKLPVDQYLGPSWTPGTSKNKSHRDMSIKILRGFADSSKTNPASAAFARAVLDAMNNRVSDAMKPSDKKGPPCP